MNMLKEETWKRKQQHFLSQRLQWQPLQQDAEAAARAQEEAALQKELRSRSAASKKEPPTVAEKLISKTMTRMENKAVDTIVRGIFNQMKKWF